jgi:hypothetical protein
MFAGNTSCSGVRLRRPVRPVSLGLALRERLGNGLTTLGFLASLTPYNTQRSQHYHKRSNVESTFSMMKRKFGDGLAEQERRCNGQRDEMKKCAFCTRPADSPEHVFSDWMLSLLPPNERYICNERLVSHDEYVRYKKKKVKITAKAVCTPCNNGWMSTKIEGRLISVLKDALVHDVQKSFGAKDLTAIATFGFKTLILANHKDLKTTPFFAASQRFRFRRDLSIPDGVQIWMATRKAIAGKYYGFWKSAQGKSEKRFRYGFANYICTWNFQNIVLQIVATKWQDKRRRNTVPPISFPQNDDWEKASVLIWPLPSTDVPWPPEFFLGDNTLLQYRDRWDTIKVQFS